MKAILTIGNKNYSSWSLRAWLVLRESGIDFEERRIALDVPSTRRELFEASAAGLVPVLRLDDLTVWDTMAIAETIAERWPEKQLWPADDAARAHARSICAEMHTGFSALRNAMPMNCRAMGRKVEVADELGDDINRIIEIWAECRGQYSEHGDWLFGDFSIADAMFAPVALRFRTYGINMPESASFYPRRLLQSEAMQAWLLAAESETEVIEREEIGQ
jgi:glutathione S-transferase